MSFVQRLQRLHHTGLKRRHLLHLIVAYPKHDSQGKHEDSSDDCDITI